jgi:pimeloyl-ACP methyl ester carboxylesterase
MAEFVLIHGACHRAGVWKAVLPALSALGHSAKAISLVGDTLDDHARQIVAASPAGAILLGHSAGGFSAHAAALAQADHFGGLIYLCAFIPSTGQSVQDLRRAAPNDQLGPAIRTEHGRYHFDLGLAANLFFHDCPTPQTHAAALRSDPIAPTQIPLAPLPAAFPRAAIICDHDRAITRAYQEHMAQDVPLQAHLPCGHAPFYAAPALLAQTMHDLATQMRRR